MTWMCDALNMILKSCGITCVNLVPYRYPEARHQLLIHHFVQWLVSKFRRLDNFTFVGTTYNRRDAFPSALYFAL